MERMIFKFQKLFFSNIFFFFSSIVVPFSKRFMKLNIVLFQATVTYTGNGACCVERVSTYNSSVSQLHCYLLAKAHMSWIIEL